LGIAHTESMDAPVISWLMAAYSSFYRDTAFGLFHDFSPCCHASWYH